MKSTIVYRWLGLFLTLALSISVTANAQATPAQKNIYDEQFVASVESMGTDYIYPCVGFFVTPYTVVTSGDCVRATEIGVIKVATGFYAENQNALSFADRGDLGVLFMEFPAPETVDLDRDAAAMAQHGVPLSAIEANATWLVLQVNAQFPDQGDGLAQTLLNAGIPVALPGTNPPPIAEPPTLEPLPELVIDPPVVEEEGVPDGYMECRPGEQATIIRLGGARFCQIPPLWIPSDYLEEDENGDWVPGPDDIIYGRWGDFDRMGIIGQIFPYDNPYNGDREYFRLVSHGGDGRYWYFPTDKSDNAYWEYLGTEKPATPINAPNVWGANDRKGAIGDIFVYANPYNGDVEYFELTGLGGDDRYWYYPTDKSDNQFWTYRGMAMPGSESGSPRSRGALVAPRDAEVDFADASSTDDVELVIRILEALVEYLRRTAE